MQRILLSRRIWGALRYTSFHYPYQKSIKQPKNRTAMLERIGSSLLYVAPAIGFYIVFLVEDASLTVLIIAGLLFGFPLLFVTQSWKIPFVFSGAVASARLSSTYDLLCLSRLGEMGATWILCANHIRRSMTSRPSSDKVKTTDSRSWIRQKARLITIFVAGLLVSILIVLMMDEPLNLINPYTETPIMMIAVVLANAFSIMIAMYFDMFQTPAIGSTIGMLVPTFVRKSIDAQFCAVFLFFVAQFTTYGLTFIIGFFSLPMVFDSLGFTSWIAGISLAILRLLIFVLTREGLIYLLWRLLTRQLNSLQEELDFAIRLGL